MTTQRVSPRSGLVSPPAKNGLASPPAAGKNGTPQTTSRTTGRTRPLQLAPPPPLQQEQRELLSKPSIEDVRVLSVDSGDATAKGTSILELPTTPPLGSASDKEDWVVEWRDYAKDAGLTDNSDIVNNVLAGSRPPRIPARRGQGKLVPSLTLLLAGTRRGLVLYRDAEIARATKLRSSSWCQMPRGLQRSFRLSSLRPRAGPGCARALTLLQARRLRGALTPRLVCVRRWECDVRWVAAHPPLLHHHRQSNLEKRSSSLTMIGRT